MNNACGMVFYEMSVVADMFYRSLACFFMLLVIVIDELFVPLCWSIRLAPCCNLGDAHRRRRERNGKRLFISKKREREK